MREAFDRVPGTWTARVSCGSSFWTIIVERALDGCRRTVILAPHQRTPSEVAAELNDALRDFQ
jgi:hypothetical protein